jgi:hypothetical protein
MIGYSPSVNLIGLHSVSYLRFSWDLPLEQSGTSVTIDIGCAETRQQKVGIAETDRD